MRVFFLDIVINRLFLLKLHFFQRFAKLMKWKKPACCQKIIYIYLQVHNYLTNFEHLKEPSVILLFIKPAGDKFSLESLLQLDDFFTLE